jgi:hypothetical protein
MTVGRALQLNKINLRKIKKNLSSWQRCYVPYTFPYRFSFRFSDSVISKLLYLQGSHSKPIDWS